MSLIARLGVILGLDNKEFISGIDDATKKTREFEMNQKRALRNAQKAQDEFMGLAARGLAGIAAASLAVGKAFQYADQIEDTAKAYDVTTQSLMALQAAFVAAGGEADNAGGALQKLAIAQQGAIDGSDELRESFKKLGISGKDVEELQLGDLFKRVAQELAKVENATQRTALQTELLGKAVKGTNWKDFVDNYKELGDPSLLKAIEENAKAWGNIEATFKELLMVAQKLVMPFALIVNSISDIRKEYQRLQKGGGAEIDFGAAFGGMPGEAVVGTYYDAPSQAGTKPIAKTEKTGDYKTQSTKQQSEAKRAAEEAKRIKEMREGLQLEIKLIKEKIDFAEKNYALDVEAITLGDMAVAQRRSVLAIDEEIETIKTNAAKERVKENAQIDLINQKEKKQIELAINSRVNAFELLEKKQNYLHQLAIQAMRDESTSRANAMQVETRNELNLLDLESERFKLGSDAYEMAKLQVGENDKLREIHLKAHEAVKQISKEYELSAKSAKDLEIYEENISKIKHEVVRQIAYTQIIEEKKQQNLKEQLEIEKQLFALDLAQQKGRDIANIQANLNIEKQRLEVESQRYLLTQNQYNQTSLLIENANRLAAAEKKYNEDMIQAQYEMERQGGGQKAREKYEERIRAITEVRDIELQAIKQVNDARQRNLEKEIQRQQSFTEGWQYAFRRYMEDSEKSFNRGARAFESVMSNMESAIDRFVETGKFSFRDFATSVIKDLIRIQIQEQTTKLFSYALDFAGGFSGGSGKGLNVDAGIGGNAGFAAAGGSIDGPTIVGENGPELFVPSQRGTVIPNTIAPSMAGMGQPQVVYNGPYIQNMSAIDTQSAAQFLSKNRMSVYAAGKYAEKSLMVKGATV